MHCIVRVHCTVSIHCLSVYGLNGTLSVPMHNVLSLAASLQWYLVSGAFCMQSASARHKVLQMYDYSVDELGRECMSSEEPKGYRIIEQYAILGR